jgi:hypothetical protein
LLHSSPKTRLDLAKAAKVHGSRLAAKMTMMLAMSRIIAQHAAIVARVDQRIDDVSAAPRAGEGKYKYVDVGAH